MTKPFIGIALDCEPEGGYAAFEWYALRCNYFEAISRAGGIPLGLSYETLEDLDPILELLSGLVLAGGDHDLDPALYGGPSTPYKNPQKKARVAFEKPLLEKVLHRQMPFLGICAGHQLLNVVRGGTLISHIPHEIENALVHEQPHPKNVPSHDIHIVKDTLLHSIAAGLQAQVNSTHHQAVKTVGKGLVINAKAPDGVIEGIEDPNLPFCMGVEWHPEYGITDLNLALFQKLIKTAQHYKKKING